MVPQRLLRRSSENRMIAGVCGGLAEYFGMDPVLMRVLYVVGSIISAAFPGLLVYIVLWIIIPERGNDEGWPPQARW
ncbi:MAG: PspC family transcriptional regulator [Phycisphaerae bacterium]